MTESVERAPLTGYWRLSMYGRQAFLGDSKAFEQVLCVSLISPLDYENTRFSRKQVTTVNCRNQASAPPPGVKSLRFLFIHP